MLKKGSKIGQITRIITHEKNNLDSTYDLSISCAGSNPAFSAIALIHESGIF